MKPTKLVPIFKGGAVHLVDEEIAFMMAAEADKGLPSFESSNVIIALEPTTTRRCSLKGCSQLTNICPSTPQSYFK